MRALLALCFLLSCSAALAQPAKEPTDAAYKQMVEAYGQYDVDKIGELLPPLEKKYPDNIFIRFFRGLYQDKGEGDVNGALRTYSEVLKADPEFLDALMFRAVLFADKGLYEKAIADATVAIKIAPKEPERYKDRGEYYFSAEKWGEAAADFRQAIALNGEKPGYYRGAYRSLINAGRAAEAEKMFTTALSGSLKNRGGVASAYGDFLLMQKRFEESKAQFTKAFADAAFKPSGDDYNSAAIASLRSADRKSAEQFMDKAIAANPQNIDYILNRADIAIEAQEWEKVYSLAQQALALSANHPKANMMMAVGVKRTGRGDALSAEYEAKAKKLAAAQSE